MAKLILGAVLGGAAGYLLYRFIGCSAGACALMSHPVIAAVFGAVLGLLAAAV